MFQRDPPSSIGAQISLKELCALHNLADKSADDEIDWMNQSDAMSLKDLGLAEPCRGGWAITARGLAVVRAQPEAVGPGLTR